METDAPDEVADEMVAGTVGARWGMLRDQVALAHLDTAACGRTSRHVRDRVLAHMSEEARNGGYVTEASAAADLAQARTDLATLLGFSADDVAFVESASAALTQLLGAWPLQHGDAVWVAPSEWGPNLSILTDGGLSIGWLEVDDHGVIDVAALAARLDQERPALVHVTTVSAHRALVQPMADVVAACARHEVPVIADCAQAVGHLDIGGAPGPAAMYGTGRKYLCGPRGVGFLAVRDPWQANLVPRAPALGYDAWPGTERPVRRLESREAFVAGRLGLGMALRELVELGPAAVFTGLQIAAAALRGALGEVPGWEAVGPSPQPSAIVSLRPTRDVDVQAVRESLLGRGVLCTAGYPERAPREMTGPLLRFSPHVDLTVAQVERAARALADVSTL
jgi:pyridoxal 5-phosphate dependent beta-lyase